MTWLSEHQPEWAHSCAGGTHCSWRGVWAAVRAIAHPERQTWTLLATILGSSMAFIDASVVNVALPTIGRDLGLGLVGRQWVFLSYSLALASFYLVGGAAGDRYGHRRTFLWGVSGFAVASVLAGAAPDGGFLIGARALQGVAGAFLTTGSLSTLRAAYGSESGRALGLWTAWTGITSVVGPPLGAVLTEYASWRLIFFVNPPLAVVVYVCARRGVDDDPVPTAVRRPFDVAGSVWVAVGLASLTYALVEWRSDGAAGVAWALVLGLVSLAAFVVRELRSANPILRLSLFRGRNFSAANLETLFVYGAIGGAGFYLALYLQTVIGYSPLEASVVLLPVSAVMLILSGMFGRLADRHGPRLYLSVGPVLIALAMMLWSRVSNRSSWWELALGVAVYSLGLAVTVAPITATALSSVPPGLAGTASGVNNTLSRVGSLLAVAVMGVLISTVYTSNALHSAFRPLTGAPPTVLARSASVDAWRAAMLLAAAFALAGGLVAALRVSNTE